MAKASGGTRTSTWRRNTPQLSAPRTVLGLSQPKYGMPKGSVEYRNEAFNPVESALKDLRDYIKENKTGGSLNLIGNDYVIIHMKGDKSSDGGPYDITLQRGDDILPKGLRASQIIAIERWMSGSEGGTNELYTRNARVTSERYRQSKARKTTIYRRKK